ncbi:MAG: nucleotidyl transferase AbiEii/AbiGii toxin family protein [Gammaproteobacteria bacterium]
MIFEPVCRIITDILDKNLFLPIPFTVKTLVPSDLFSGKIHVLLCRPWKKRIKGRDWYDFSWYIARGISVNLDHVRERLIESQAWDSRDKLTLLELKKLMTKK